MTATATRAVAATALVALAPVALLADGLPLAEGQPVDGASPDAMAAELVGLYRMALAYDEMRSHLPYWIQLHMGAGPFTIENPRACHVLKCAASPTTWHVGKWDHESYLRSRGMDTHVQCAMAYHDLVARKGWLRDGAYWEKFMLLCGESHTDTAVSHFERILGSVSHECETLIAEGWFVNSLDRLYRHGLEGIGHNFSVKCLPQPEGDGFFAYGGLLWGAGGSERFEYPGYAPNTMGGDGAGAPKASNAKEYADRLADLYEGAMAHRGVMTLLPADIRDAMSSGWPGTYYMAMVDGEWVAAICLPPGEPEFRHLC